MELGLLFAIPSSLPFFVTFYAICQLQAGPPHYYLHRLPFLAKFVYLVSLPVPPPYNLVPSSLAILLAWFGAAVYWVNLYNKSQVIRKCERGLTILAAGSLILTFLFWDDPSPKPWAEESARVTSIIFAFAFFVITFPTHSYPSLFLIFGAIVAAQPMQMTLHLTTALLESYFGDTRAEPILRFFWFLAAGFEGILPLYAATYLASGEIVWPEFKLPGPIYQQPCPIHPPAYHTIAVATDDERRALLNQRR